MKKFLAAVLATALIITGLYPVQFLKAAPTTKQNDGLNFANSSPWLYSGMEGYYKAEKIHDSLPKGFEATVRIPKGEEVFAVDDRVIFSNGSIGSTVAGTVEFGVTCDTFAPKLAVVDASGTRTEYEFQSSGDVTTLQTGEWLHLAIAADSTSGKISAYVNGELFGSVEGTIPDMTPAKAFCIAGDYSWTNTSTFMGDIKNVAVWSNLTADAIATHALNDGVVTAGAEGLISAYNLKLETNGTYPDKLIDVNGKVDFVSTTAKFITEEEAVALSKRPENYDFSMVVIGDQQVLTAYQAQDAVRVKNGGRNWYPDQRVTKVFQWVVDNVESKNIKFAFNMGDIVDNYAKNSAEQNTQEWIEGAKALKLLDGKVPYSLVRGNHDADAEFNQYFPLSGSKEAQGTEVVSFDGTTMNNTYQKFQAGGIKYLVINLDFGIAAANTNGDEILTWANQVVESNPDYNVIVSTHGYMGADGVRLNTETHGDGGMTNSYYSRAKSGEDIWNEFVKLHENIVMVLSGHVGSDGIIKTEDTGVNGNKVVELCVNAQVLDVDMQAAGNYQSGNVAMLYFSEGGTKVTVENYSTIRDQYYGPANQFTMTLNRIGEGQTYDLENGAIAVPYSMVDRTGTIPTVDATFGDYVFAGWYTSAGCSSDLAIWDTTNLPTDCYAKFIPRDLLSVKAQVSTEKLGSGENAGDWAIRFISSVESLNYKKVGFEIVYDDNGVERGKGTSSMDTVYEKIKSTEEENAYYFSPRVISLNSEYFVTAKLAVAPEDVAEDYTVRAYVETFDGTKVYGPARTLCVNDGLESTTVNLVVQASSKLSGNNYSATFGLDGTGTSAAEVKLLASDETGYSTFRVTLPAGTSLPSASKFLVKDGNSNIVATEIHRNYYTTHDNGTTTAQSDTSWYYIDTTADLFIIGSSADMYGLNDLIGSGVYFQDKTVLLIRDVALNDGTVTPGTGATAPSWSGTTFNWNAKGGNWGSSCFNGTFDGDGNVISGLYSEDSSTAVGLFGSLAPKAIVRNLGLTNSYIKASNDYVGSIVGYSYAAKVENVYSDAVIYSTFSTGTWNGKSLGGIVGHMDTLTAGSTHTILGCWFDGRIYYSGANQQIGGIAGKIYDSQGSKFELYDCLFSGDIYMTSTSSYRDGAGIISGVNGTGGVAEVYMKNCLNTGTMKGTGSWGIGAALQGAKGGSISHCYAVESSVYPRAFYDTGSISISNQGVVTKASLIFADESAMLEKLPLLTGQKESAWMCYEDSTPVLKTFADVWLDKQ